MAATMLDEPTWTARRTAHETRVDEWTAPVLARASRGQVHPIEDFLFNYYPHRPARLRRWSPGPGVVLAGAPPLHGEWQPAGAGWLLAPAPDRILVLASRTRQLLEQTMSRPARFGCFGLHEWAMVYRQGASEVRHSQLPLRLGAAGTAAVVEAQPLQCSHFDAFRFFTEPAKPLNAVQPTRSTQPDLEQGGCLHANMDLYKWSFQLSPWVPSELVADCFELARRVRSLDMRASPYDVTSLGLEPVRIETAQGKEDYATQQRSFAIEATALRIRLLAAVS